MVVGCHALSSCAATSGLLRDAVVREHGRGNHGQDDGPETDAVSEERQNKALHQTSAASHRAALAGERWRSTHHSERWD
jgi:hypothetical protein